ncbi:hypothetical protein LTR91_024107, partial [Friedmanniomyces endolithicus]
QQQLLAVLRQLHVVMLHLRALRYHPCRQPRQARLRRQQVRILRRQRVFFGIRGGECGPRHASPGCRHQEV